MFDNMSKILKKAFRKKVKWLFFVNIQNIEEHVSLGKDKDVFGKKKFEYSKGQ